MKLLAILVIFYFPIILTAQKSISLNPNWVVGEKFQFEVTKITLKVKNDSIIKNDSSSYIGHWELLEKYNTGFRLKWLMSNDYLNKHQSFEKYKPKKDQNIEFIYTVNLKGEFIKLENWKEVRKEVFAIFDEIKNEQFETKDDEKAAKASLKFLKAFYRDESTIQEMIGKEIIAIHGLFGIELNSPKDTIFIKDEVYNLLSENPIPTTTHIYLKELDKTKNLCTFYRINKYDPEAAKKLALKLSKRYGKASSDENDDDLTLDIQKTHKATFIYSKGIPIRIETETKTIANTTHETGFSSKKVIIEQTK